MAWGSIYKLGKDSIQYRVRSIKDLIVIIDHFDSLKASMNLGLSSLLKQGLSDIIPVERLKVAAGSPIQDPL
jgi:hypothetical protein